MGQPTKKILKTWIAPLENCGFRLKGGLAVRQIGILEHGIGLQRSQRAAPGKIRINLYISVKDNFREPPESLVCLHGSVAQGGASFFDDGSWWQEEDLVRRGLQVLLE